MKLFGVFFSTKWSSLFI